MAYNMKPTRNGHNFYDMSSMLQKAIRRADYNHAGYAANELFQSYSNYLWKRLLVISAEDCYGIMTKEIIGLKLADDVVNKGKSGAQKDAIFVSKAVLLLCMARKNRDACYFACNFMSDDLLIPEEDIPPADFDNCKLDVSGIPDWVFDHHTLKGKMMGKTTLDMLISEQAALVPHQESLFDDGDWGQMYDKKRHRGKLSNEEAQRYEEWKKTKTHY